MRKIVILFIFLIIGMMAWPIKPEKVISELHYGMSLEDVRKICDKDLSCQYAKKIGMRLVRFNFYASEENFLVEYLMQFDESGLISCAKRTSVYDDWSVVLLNGDNPIDNSLNSKRFSYVNGPFEVDERLVLKNLTLALDRFSVYVFSVNQQWSYIGKTKSLSSFEDFKFPFDLSDYALYKKPIVKLAILSESGKLYTISVDKDNDDLIVSVMDDEYMKNNKIIVNSDGTVREPDASIQLEKPSSPQDIKTRLEVLKELYDSGIITESEYQEKRQHILQSL